MIRATKKGIQDLAKGRVDLFRIDPREIRIEPGWNVRTIDFAPDDAEDMALALSIKENGVRSALTVYMRDGEPTLTDGHRRLRATLYAIEHLSADIETVPVQTETRGANEVDRVLSMDIRNAGKQLAPIERAALYSRLIGLGLDEGQIATRTGRSRQYVTNLLTLREGPTEVVRMVEAGEVSATLAMSTLREAKDDAAATEKLAEAVTAAKAQGRMKATAKHLKPKPPKVEVLSVPKDHPTYKAGWEDGKSEGRAAAARDAVEIAKRFLTTRDADGEAGEIWAVRQVVDALEAEVSR